VQRSGEGVEVGNELKNMVEIVWEAAMTHEVIEVKTKRRE
jgi:hypothetical protein